jgi:hypothetical protein
MVVSPGHVCQLPLDVSCTAPLYLHPTSPSPASPPTPTPQPIARPHAQQCCDRPCHEATLLPPVLPARLYSVCNPPLPPLPTPSPPPHLSPPLSAPHPAPACQAKRGRECIGASGNTPTGKKPTPRATPDMEGVNLHNMTLQHVGNCTSPPLSPPLPTSPLTQLTAPQLINFPSSPVTVHLLR